MMIKLPDDLIDKPFVDIGDMVRIFPYSPSGVRALVRKKKLPRPFRLDGKDIWSLPEIVDHVRLAASNNRKAA